MTEDHAIFVGGKPFMNYVTAVVMQFTTKGADKVVVRSRGKFISRAVDVSEVVKSRFLKDQIEVSNISMDSEEFKNKEGRTVRVSTLDITLNRIASQAKPAATTAEPVKEVKEPVVEEPVKEAEPVAEGVEAEVSPEAEQEKPAEEPEEAS